MRKLTPIFLAAGVILASVGAGAAVGPLVSTRPGFTARFVATQALSFDTPSGGAYGSVSSNGSSITVAASGSAGSTFQMQIPVNNQANSQVQYELRAIGLDFGRKSTVQGGDLTVWHGQPRQAADLGRLIYGGAAWLEDGSGQRLPGSADGLFQGESNPNGGAANDVGVLSCVTGLSVSPENLAVPATCLTHSAVRSGSRTDLLYVDGTGLKLVENRMTAPEGARALWLVTVEQEAGEAANTATAADDLRQPFGGTIALNSPFAIQVEPGVWEITLAPGQSTVLDVDIALPNSLPPGFSGIRFALAPRAD